MKKRRFSTQFRCALALLFSLSRSFAKTPGKEDCKSLVKSRWKRRQEHYETCRQDSRQNFRQEFCYKYRQKFCQSPQEFQVWPKLSQTLSKNWIILCLTLLYHNSKFSCFVMYINHVLNINN